MGIVKENLENGKVGKLQFIGLWTDKLLMNNEVAASG